MVTAIKTYEPLEWAAKAWGDKSPSILYSGSAGGGKSKAAGEVIHALCKAFPNSTAVILRKDKAACSISVEPFMKNEIIGDDPECTFRQSRIDYRNGSEIIFAGMFDDKQREKVRSIGKHGKVDFIWAEEAISFTEKDYNEMCGRLRGTAASFTQIILTTNPGPPTHWIYKRLILGNEATVYYSGAIDNPHNPDSYVARLNQLTGVQYQRLVLGKWKMAEGAVYTEFDASIHIIDRFPIPADWYRYRVIDFGFNNPCVCQWWAMDNDDRLYRYRELYESELVIDDFGAKIDRHTGNEVIQQTIADHDKQQRELLKKLNIPTRGAKKDVDAGIHAVKARLRPSGDGKPRMFFMRNSLIEIDPKLLRKGKPTCTEEELPGYEWEKSRDGSNEKETPRKENDHGCDSTRYITMYVDRHARQYDLS